MKNKMMDDIENIGIMQGFLDDAAMEEDELEEEEYSDESQAARMLDRRPGSPEILMNNLRGDMRSVDTKPPLRPPTPCSRCSSRCSRKAGDLARCRNQGPWLKGHSLR